MTAVQKRLVGLVIVAAAYGAAWALMAGSRAGPAAAGPSSGREPEWSVRAQLSPASAGASRGNRAPFPNARQPRATDHGGSFARVPDTAFVSLALKRGDRLVLEAGAEARVRRVWVHGEWAIAHVDVVRPGRRDQHYEITLDGTAEGGWDPVEVYELFELPAPFPGRAAPATGSFTVPP